MLNMQITCLNPKETALILRESNELTRFMVGSSTTYILESAYGRDILLMVCNVSGAGQMFDGCMHDAETGGSVHDHARATVDA
jgi:hypothetical protein